MVLAGPPIARTIGLRETPREAAAGACPEDEAAETSCLRCSGVRHIDRHRTIDCDRPWKRDLECIPGARELERRCIRQGNRTHDHVVGQVQDENRQRRTDDLALDPNHSRDRIVGEIDRQREVVVLDVEVGARGRSLDALRAGCECRLRVGAESGAVDLVCPRERRSGLDRTGECDSQRDREPNSAYGAPEANVGGRGCLLHASMITHNDAAGGVAPAGRVGAKRRARAGARVAIAYFSPSFSMRCLSISFFRTSLLSTLNSTRRFSARPAAALLSAIGWPSP